MEILKIGKDSKSFIKISTVAAGTFFILSTVIGLLSTAGLEAGFTVILVGVIMGVLKRWV